jgi:hypothetical protein
MPAMDQTKTKRVITALVVFGITAVIGILIFYDWILNTMVGFAYDFFVKPPERTICLNVQDEYRCIAHMAIQDKDPSYCWYLDAGSSDRCSEEVMRAVPDVALCKKIPQWRLRRECTDSFK